MDFSASSQSSVSGDSKSDITILAGTTVKNLALFDALTEGNHLGTFYLDNPETFSNEGGLGVINLTITLS